MSVQSRGIFKSTKSAMIFCGVFFGLFIVLFIINEIDMADWVYGDPYEMQAVVTDKRKSRKISNMDSNGIAKGMSDDFNYDYYVYVELENGVEKRMRCTLESDYDKYKVGQQVTMICQDVTEDGEFSHVAYYFKEE